MNDELWSQHHFRGHEIKISGFETEINDIKEIMGFIKDLTDKNDCTVQLMRARGIAGEKHALQATAHAIKAFERNENTAKDLGLEICLRASAQRQISKALKILGINKGKNDLCVVAVDGGKSVQKKLENVLGPKQKVLKPDIEVLQELYQISPLEIESAGDMERVMVERSAILNLEL
ncbi:KEOPS complex subunit Cgi121 [Methanobacterium formicicum]|uniref:KEOPS complex subunit Cgi121 n=1 Tax=Methanobacterium formicicum TaxID=2162 RepID=UPI002412ADC5|nr:KEOPS complex subunit Cgi121 [Methanobacterium formicicum]MDG3546642.1 KEOPS complex subunit Cgi121 [Methanobacterium formicicum]